MAIGPQDFKLEIPKIWTPATIGATENIIGTNENTIDTTEFITGIYLLKLNWL